jgi:hypothetical protein
MKNANRLREPWPLVVPHLLPDGAAQSVPNADGIAGKRMTNATPSENSFFAIA